MDNQFLINLEKNDLINIINKFQIQLEKKNTYYRNKYNNDEENKQKRKESSKRYYEKNKEKVNARQRAYYLKNKKSNEILKNMEDSKNDNEKVKLNIKIKDNNE